MELHVVDDSILRQLDRLVAAISWIVSSILACVLCLRLAAPEEKRRYEAPRRVKRIFGLEKLRRIVRAGRGSRQRKAGALIKGMWLGLSEARGPELYEELEKLELHLGLLIPKEELERRLLQHEVDISKATGRSTHVSSLGWKRQQLSTERPALGSTEQGSMCSEGL